MLKRLLVGGLGLLMLAACSGPESEVAASGQPSSVQPPSTGGSSVTEKRWVPKQGTAWQWQLQGKLDLSVDVPVYDVDWQTTSEAEIAELHRKGRHVICYVSVGSYEKYRPDAKTFPASLLGKELDGWPDERWLDIRQWDQLEPIMAARFDQCRAKGFDAVEPDNVDGYSNESGFPLTGDDQLTFNRRIADLAHARGMSVGLKNDVEQAAALEPSFDFAVNEECMRYDECEMLRPFLQAGKAVLHVEYDLDPAEYCAKAKAMGLSSMRKPLELGADRQPC
jgi:hypothetical protein